MIFSPFRALVAGSRPARARMSGTDPGLSGDMCSTTNSEPGKSSGSPPTSRCNAATPPAEAPTTKMSRTGMTDHLRRQANASRPDLILYADAGRIESVGRRVADVAKISAVLPDGERRSASEPSRDPCTPASEESLDGGTGIPALAPYGARPGRQQRGWRVTRGTPWAGSPSVFREGGELVRLRRVAQLAERLGLDLADALAGDAEHLSDFLERVVGHAADAEAHAQDLLLARRELGERLGHRLRQRAALGRGVRIGRVRRLDQIAQGGIAVLADGQVERHGVLHHGQNLLDASDRNARTRRHFGGAGIAPFLLVELAPLAQHFCRGLRHVHRDANGAALV